MNLLDEYLKEADGGNREHSVEEEHREKPPEKSIMSLTTKKKAKN